MVRKNQTYLHWYHALTADDLTTVVGLGMMDNWKRVRRLHSQFSPAHIENTPCRV